MNQPRRTPSAPAEPAPWPWQRPLSWLDAESALRHLDRLHAAALALCGNRADAEDLVQDVCVALLRRPRRLSGGSELAYLLTMVRNRHIDERRTATRRGTGVLLYDADEPVDPRAGLRPDCAAEHGEVLATVHELDSPFRETVVAVDVLGLSYKEAAEALGTPVGTVMSRLARGRQRVVRALEPELTPSG
jgi:RNA polymerase sigma-70 factor (ECF subfamily)